MANLAKIANEIVAVGIGFGLGIGILGTVLGSFASGLTANSIGQNLTNSVLTAFVTPIKTIWPVVVILMLVLLIVVVARKMGYLGGDKGHD